MERTAEEHKIADVIHADAELTELTWLPIITGLVLDELESSLAEGFDPEMPLPFYCHREHDFSREYRD